MKQPSMKVPPKRKGNAEGEEEDPEEEHPQ